MQLAVSSAVAPDLPLADLLQGCQRRGLAAVELVIDSLLPPADAELESLARRVRAVTEGGSVRIASVAILEATPRVESVLALARALEVPAVFPAWAVEGPAPQRSIAVHLSGGGRVLLLHGSDPEGVAALRARIESPIGEGAHIAWQVDPARDVPGRAAEVLQAAGPLLRYVRLLGGGPEADRQAGLGLGTLMGRLALGRFNGPLVLAPGDAGYHRAWRSWLTRAGGWGCGSKQSDPSLVSLDPSPTPTRKRAS